MVKRGVKVTDGAAHGAHRRAALWRGNKRSARRGRTEERGCKRCVAFSEECRTKERPPAVCVARREPRMQRPAARNGARVVRDLEFGAWGLGLGGLGLVFGI